MRLDHSGRREGACGNAARDLVFGEDFEASVYRVFLNGRPHVIAVGEHAPPSGLAMRLPMICDKGESVSIPDEVVFQLALRRTKFYGPDVKFERRSGL